MGSAALQLHALRVEECHSNAFSIRICDENTGIYGKKI